MISSPGASLLRLRNTSPSVLLCPARTIFPPSPGFPLEKLEGEIWDELETLRRDPLSAETLLKAKKQIRSAFLQSLQTHFFKGLLAGLYQVRAGDYRHLYQILSRSESVTAEEVLQAARKYLRPENRTVVSLQPVTQAEHDELGEIE